MIIYYENKKILEELEEVFAATTQAELIEELGDLEEVLNAFKVLTKIDQKAIDQSRKEKFLKKGGYQKRLYMHYIDAPENSWEYEYCLKNPEKYPEIVA